MNGLVPAALVTALFAMGAAIAYDILAPLPRSEASESPDRTTEGSPSAAPVFVPPPIQTFSVVNRRPLFSRSRQAISDPVEVDNSDDGSQGSGIQLVGIMIGMGRSVALLRSVATAETAGLSPGDSFQGWQLVTIGPAEAVLRSAARNIAIRLHPIGSHTTSRPQTASPAASGVLQSGVVAAPPMQTFKMPSNLPPPPIYKGRPGTNRRHSGSR
jgi:hypothetical protein